MSLVCPPGLQMQMPDAILLIGESDCPQALVHVWHPCCLQAYGSHYFLLPLLEYLEAEHTGILAATIAWDPAAAAAAQAAVDKAAEHEQEGQAHEQSAHHAGGCVDFYSAMQRALAALSAMHPPAPAAAPAPKISSATVTHTPSLEQWRANMASLLGALAQARAGTGTGGSMDVEPLSRLESLDLGLARQEFLTHGQQVRG